MLKMKLFVPATMGLLMVAGVAMAQPGHEGHNHGTPPTADAIHEHTQGKTVFELNGIKLTTVEGSPDFPSAELKLKSPANGAVVAEGKVLFQYDVKNYDLKKQTGDHQHCANSAQGQHIHLILNNEPYVALYNDTFSKDLKPGGYVALSFLSRSYHESVKHKAAYTLQYFSVGTKAVKNEVDLKAPAIFYSRPKGDYKGSEETTHVLLDYFLVNCTLSKEGYKVKATIDGTEFTLTKWEPYFVDGLALGKHTIKLELIDKAGKTVKNKFNPVERSINLLPADPAK